MVIENERIVAVGNFIDSNIILTWISAFVTSFVTYWLFVCACKRQFSLTWKEVIVVCAFIIAIRIISLFDNNIATHISISSFFIIPLIFKHDLRIATVAYAIHGLSQVLSLGIRNLPMYFTNINSTIAIIATLECYLWLALIYIIFNYTEENDDGSVVSPLLRKFKLLFQEEGKSSKENRETSSED